MNFEIIKKEIEDDGRSSALSLVLRGLKRC